MKKAVRFLWWLVKRLFSLLKGGISTAAAVLLIAGGLAGIIGAVALSVRMPLTKTLATIGSTVVSCVCMIPVLPGFNRLVRKEAQAKQKGETTKAALKEEIQEAEQKIAKQQIEIDRLRNDLTLKEHAMLSFQSFEKASKVTLLEMKMKQTEVTNKPLGKLKGDWLSTGFGLQADHVQDEILVVHTHDIVAGLGFDLKGIKISSRGEHTVAVSGLCLQCTSRPSADTATPLKEIRTVKYRKTDEGAVIDNVIPRYDKASIIRAGQLADDYQKAFREKLKETLNIDFVHDGLTSWAQDFIRLILAPLGKEIVFTDEETSNALPLTEHLKREIGKTSAQIASAKALLIEG